MTYNFTILGVFLLISYFQILTCQHYTILETNKLGVHSESCVVLCLTRICKWISKAKAPFLSSKTIIYLTYKKLTKKKNL